MDRQIDLTLLDRETDPRLQEPPGPSRTHSAKAWPGVRQQNIGAAAWGGGGSQPTFTHLLKCLPAVEGCKVEEVAWGPGSSLGSVR